MTIQIQINSQDSNLALAEVEDVFPSVAIQCYWYVVDFGPSAKGQRFHNVAKTKQCTCRAKGACPAVQAVIAYLRAGGLRAPEPRRDFWPALPKVCPICGSSVVADSALNSLAHGRGWQCNSESSHYWQIRWKPKISR